jgi:hypothetical protein
MGREQNVGRQRADESVASSVVHPPSSILRQAGTAAANRGPKRGVAIARDAPGAAGGICDRRAGVQALCGEAGKQVAAAVALHMRGVPVARALPMKGGTAAGAQEGVPRFNEIKHL